MMNSARSSSHEEEVEQLSQSYISGWEHAKKGNLHASVYFFNEAIKDYPNDAGAYIHKCNNFIMMNRYTDAFDCLKEAPNKMMRNATIEYLKGHIQHCLHNYEDAIKFYDIAIWLDPKDHNVYNSKGLCLEELYREKEALKCYDAALIKNNNSFELYYNKGMCLKKLRRYEEAIETFDDALCLNHKHYPSYDGKGECFRMLTKDRAALECFDTSISINPHGFVAYYSKANCLFFLELEQQALKCIEVCVSLNPNEPKSQCLKADLLYRLEDYDAALQCYHRAIGLKDDEYYWFWKRGECFLARGQTKQAEADFRQTHEMIKGRVGQDIYDDERINQIMAYIK